MTGPVTDSDVGMIAGYPLPPRLTESTEPGLAAWRRELPGVVEELLSRWRLRVSAPFLPGGSSAWVAPVQDAEGAERVLKVAWAHEESLDEAAGMVAWQGRGAAQLHRSERRGETSALLLERVRPGTPLAQLGTWPERDEVIAEVAQKLWVSPGSVEMPGVATARFRPLTAMCENWADLAQQRADAGRSPLPRGLVEHGLGLFRELPRSWDGEPVLLATDLHPDNVLDGGDGGRRDQHSSDRLSDDRHSDDRHSGDGPVADEQTAPARHSSGRWVLIDPKPYVGDPHYDLLQHMFNDPERLAAQPAAFADRMAGLAGLDPQRMRRWLLARSVQEVGMMTGAAQAALRLAEAGVE